jgi:hypothetical protein
MKSRYDPIARERLEALLVAGEALRAAASAFDDAFRAAPLDDSLSMTLDDIEKGVVEARHLSFIVDEVTALVDTHATPKLLAAEKKALETFR